MPAERRRFNSTSYFWMFGPHLVGCDDAADLLEVADNGPFPAEDGGGVHEQGVEDAEIAS